ncbi:hypothetical protein A6R68_01672, partial [Neotoma lepida]
GYQWFSKNPCLNLEHGMLPSWRSENKEAGGRAILKQSGGRSQLAAGTCEIVTLDRDSSQPRRTIARQTARCACRKGQIAGTTRARPACVDEFMNKPHIFLK